MDKPILIQCFIVGLFPRIKKPMSLSDLTSYDDTPIESQVKFRFLHQPGRPKT